ncbi:MAG TPA: hypothetical protein VF843_18025 [Streptosporangiaceae bacterium]
MAAEAGIAAHAQALTSAIRECWTAATSAYSSWSPARPSLGQCAVSALVIQDYLGGDLIRAENAGHSHYWNVVGGEVIDITRDQFSCWDPVGESGRSREYVLSFPDTVRRYQLLRDAVARRLGLPPPAG